jgi:anti-sigma regulatory factor (Ser/Thr protein kinase)
MAVVRKELAPDNRAPHQAREIVLGAIADLPKDVQDDAVLLVSELVSNSVIHVEAAPTDMIGLLVALEQNTLHVEVSDRSALVAQRSPPAGAGGYGLNLVDRLSTRWGAELRNGRNVTWFDMHVPPLPA